MIQKDKQPLKLIWWSTEGLKLLQLADKEEELIQTLTTDDNQINKKISFDEFLSKVALKDPKLYNNLFKFNKKAYIFCDQNNEILSKRGMCQEKYAPCSTFKILLALICYTENILKDAKNPALPFQQDYCDDFELWKQDHDPSMWIKNSCVWYSQILTKQLGIEKLQKYVNLFNYGNKNLSGDSGKNNGLTNAWLSSSLEISSEEQLLFLQNMLNKKFSSISDHAYEMTKKLLLIHKFPKGWTLYGKTGNGQFLTLDRATKTNFKYGWFIGWIENGKDKITFTYHLEDEDDQPQKISAGQRAKEKAIKRLYRLITNIQP